MRCAICALSAVLLVAGQAIAAEPGAATPPAKPPATGPAKPASPAPAPAPAAPQAPRAGDAPPAEYYVEPGSAAPDPGTNPPPPSAAPGAPPGSSNEPPPQAPGPPPPPPVGEAFQIYEPPPPGFYPGDPVFEPPPPPEPRHIAPRTSLWLGARVGWFMPFGNAWARGTANGQRVSLRGVPWRDYVTSGPMFELDAGARLSRHYNLFALWERAQLGAGRGDPDIGLGKSKSGESDFWGVGIRASSDPDGVGFVTELALGYRRARAKYDDLQIQFTDAPFEARLGIGAEIRLNRVVTLSPMFTLGVGSFGTVDRVGAGTVADHTGPNDTSDGHAWATLSLGGHFDLLGSRR